MGTAAASMALVTNQAVLFHQALLDSLTVLHTLLSRTLR